MILDGEPFMWGIPGNPDSRPIWVNVDIFDELGIEYRPEVPWTWDEFANNARRMTRTDGNGEISVGFALPLDWPFNHFPYVWSNGGEMLERHPDTGWVHQAVANQPATIEAFDWLYSLMQRQIAPPWGVNPSFHSGQVVMTQSWSSIASTAFEFRADVMPTPVPAPGMPSINIANGSSMGSIIASTPHPQEAWEVLKFLAGEEGDGIRIRHMPHPPAVMNSRYLEFWPRNVRKLPCRHFPRSDRSRPARSLEQNPSRYRRRHTDFPRGARSLLARAGAGKRGDCEYRPPSQRLSPGTVGPVRNLITVPRCMCASARPSKRRNGRWIQSADMQPQHHALCEEGSLLPDTPISAHCAEHDANQSTQIPYPNALERANIRVTELSESLDTHLIIGNGDIQGLVWFEAGNLILSLTKNDVWDARLDTTHDAPLPTLALIRELGHSGDSIVDTNHMDRAHILPKGETWSGQDSYEMHAYPCPEPAVALYCVWQVRSYLDNSTYGGPSPPSPTRWPCTRRSGLSPSGTSF